MIRILCPTDFSKHAKKALEYGVYISNLLDAELHILTAYSVPTSAGSLIAMERTIKSNREEDLNALAAGITPLITNDKMPVIHAAKGMAAGVIANYSKHHDIDLIVMGTQGINSVKNLLLGSITRKVARKINVPLLAIPMDANFEALHEKNLLLTLDSNIVEDENILQIPKLLAKKLNSSIDIFHVAKSKEDVLFDPFIEKYLNSVMGRTIVKESKFPLVEINSYLANSDVGILVMIQRNKGFFENLLLKGFTHEELGVTNTPLLVLPSIE